MPTQTAKEQFDAKMDALADSINTKAGTTGAKDLDALKTAVDGISTGTDVSGTTATAADVRSGKKFFNASGVETNGIFVVTGLNVTENDTYNAPANTAYSQVVVDVPATAKPGYLLNDGDTVTEVFFNAEYDFATQMAALQSSLTWVTDPDSGLDVCELGVGYFYAIDLTNAGAEGEYALVWNDGTNFVAIYASVAVPDYGVTNPGWQMTSYTPDDSFEYSETSVDTAFLSAVDYVFAVEKIAFGTTGIDTSDATATAGDILLGKTAYANGVKITGMASNGAVKFIGTSLTIATANSAKNWDGTLKFSYNGTTWNTWDGTTTLQNDEIWLTGIGNTKITGATDGKGFVLGGTNVSYVGNIEALLDGVTASIGKHPTMGDQAFAGLFRHCASLVSADTLPLITGNSTFAYMLAGTSLANAPALPATELGIACYSGLFSGCASLVNAPALPATTLPERCYASMFYNCTALQKLPAVSATVIGTRSCQHMFNGCINIKLSETQTGDYVNQYRIPSSGTGTDGDNSFYSMFANTGGTFTGVPTINTTYYTSNTVVE